jgi:hypothetical protein
VQLKQFLNPGGNQATQLVRPDLRLLGVHSDAAPCVIANDRMLMISLAVLVC